MSLSCPWVSVKDWGLPDEPGMYLTYWTDSSLETYFINDEELYEEVIKVDRHAVTHWAELPAPPEVKK